MFVYLPCESVCRNLFMRKVETGDLRVGRRKIRTDFPVESLMHFLTINFGTFQRDGPHETLEGNGR